LGALDTGCNSQALRFELAGISGSYIEPHRYAESGCLTGWGGMVEVKTRKNDNRWKMGARFFFNAAILPPLFGLSLILILAIVKNVIGLFQ
jgi:hypothetical protein